MKKIWLCRTSYDEKNHEIAPMMIANDDPDRVMIASDDPDPVMMSRDDLDQEMIQIR